jgi:hypothetical protein
MKLAVKFTFETKPRGWWDWCSVRGKYTNLVWMGALHFLRHFEIFVEVEKDD